jgi:hypothetical protein
VLDSDDMTVLFFSDGIDACKAAIDRVVDDG